MSRYAEKANYWDTTISPAKSQGEIIEMLEKFGADNTQMTIGSAGGRYAWLIRFQWEDNLTVLLSHRWNANGRIPHARTAKSGGRMLSRRVTKWGGSR